MIFAQSLLNISYENERNSSSSIIVSAALERKIAMLRGAWRLWPEE